MLLFIPVYFVVKFRDPETKFNAIIHTTFMIGAAGMLFALVNLGYSKKYLEEHPNIQQEIEQVDTVSH